MLKINAVFVIGHSPAIVTETLAAMHVEGNTEVASIKVISTRSGAQHLIQRLFDEGAWDDFIAAYPAYRSCDFSAQNIQGCAGEDIRSEKENRQITEAIFSAVQELTAEGMPLLMASIAGGRKTMGYYMGFAMSLFGRDGDRLTHVLVPEAWEKDRTFMFPPVHDADRVDLIDIPFIRLRSHLKPAVGKADVDKLVQSAQTAIDLSALEPVTLRIRRRMVSYLGKTVELAEREFSLLQFFAEQKHRHCSRPEKATCGECRECFLSYDKIDNRKDDLLRIRSQFGGVNDGNYVRFEEAWETTSPSSGNLHEPLRRIAEAVEKTFGPDPRSECLMIRNVGQRGHARYGMMADKSQIRIERE